MNRVINKELVQIGGSEVIEEVIVEERYLFFKITRTYRKVHGDVFLYNGSSYKSVPFWIDANEFFK